jgi:hypothetical protein
MTGVWDSRAFVNPRVGNGMSDLDLSGIKIKTLLVYPPGVYMGGYPPLGIPQMAAFLKSKGYWHLKAVDLSAVGNLGLLMALRRLAVHVVVRYSPKGPSVARKIMIFLHSLKCLFSGRSVVFQIDEKNNVSLEGMIRSAAVHPLRANRHIRHLEQTVKNHNPALIGFSVVYPEQIYHAVYLSRYLKAIDNNLTVVFGGPQITKHLEFFIKKQKYLSSVDVLIHHDGEEPLAKLIIQCASSTDSGMIPNAYFRDRDGNFRRSSAIFLAGSEHLIEPDFSGFNMTVASLRFSIGCAWNRCTFCTRRIFHERYVHGTTAVAVQNIINMQKRYRVSNFRIVDDYITPSLLRNFSKELLR